MPSSNGAPKYNSVDENSSYCSPFTSMKQNFSSGSRSLLSHKERKESSSSVLLADSTAARTSSSKILPSSNTAPTTGSASDTHRAFNEDISNGKAYAEVDLLGVSAWTYPHRSPYHYQAFSCQSYDAKHTSTCPYHVTTMDSDHGSTVSRCGSAPLQRWLDEDVEDGGALALQLGYQLRADCTCIVMKDSVGIDVASGEKHGATLEN